MGGRDRDYTEVYRSKTWAYGDKPDPELIKALVGVRRGRALDLGGGQGRHALALSALGFNVTLVDAVAEGLHQATATAEERDLPLHTVNTDVARYQPEPGLSLVVGALFFHIPASRASMKVAEKVGEALSPGGLFYVSLPGFTKETEAFAREVILTAECKEVWVVKHLVTKKERPMLSVARRNETRALGQKPGR